MIVAAVTLSVTFPLPALPRMTGEEKKPVKDEVTP